MDREFLRKEYRVFQIILTLICGLMFIIVAAQAYFFGVNRFTVGGTIIVLAYRVFIMGSLKREYKKKLADLQIKQG